MNKKIVLGLGILLSLGFLTGCGEKSEQENKIADLENELNTKNSEIVKMSDENKKLSAENRNLKNVAEELKQEEKRVQELENRLEQAQKENKELQSENKKQNYIQNDTASTTPATKSSVSNQNAKVETKTIQSNSNKVYANSKSKIYHVKGGQFYNEMSDSENLVVFNSPQEAEAAGYRISKK
ncbi:hypothetical protein [Catellicoccus marimammalium]|uniref:YttA n=1 Tax=Catellicoccus marimammalium M35/04/3 TaxID=1234409 RepID=K8Z9J3_9ENTE|nr:hypothetical protein [Catellicoccus marimammalium]EKU27709.1 YttA [Catellicoccus marimammalium M35/04/3]